MACCRFITRWTHCYLLELAALCTLRDAAWLCASSDSALDLPSPINTLVQPQSPHNDG